jgi:hypothetical protein
MRVLVLLLWLAIQHVLFLAYFFCESQQNNNIANITIANADRKQRILCSVCHSFKPLFKYNHAPPGHLFPHRITSKPLHTRLDIGFHPEPIVTDNHPKKSLCVVLIDSKQVIQVCHNESEKGRNRSSYQ